LGVRPAKKLQGLDSEGARLIETALRELGTVQRHRNDQHFGWSLAGELRDGFGEHPAKALSGGVQAIVFEGVNGFPHAALVGTIRNGSDEGRRRQAAGAAKR